MIVGAGSVVKGTLKSNNGYASIPVKYICSLEEYTKKISHILIVQNICKKLRKRSPCKQNIQESIVNLTSFHRVAHKLQQRNIPILPKIIYYTQFLLFNSSLPAAVKIGKNSVFGYGGIGVVIHERVQIGERCVLGQGITIGGRSKLYEVPILGNNVFVGPGARILGDVTIGDNVIIGANSVVIDSIPSNCIVVGIPAKIIKKNINKEDYV